MVAGRSVTMTFLFTDLARSTAQWERHPAQMSEALTVHDELLRGAVASHGGRVFATGGDGFCAAFASPTDAVSAAAGAQRRFAGQAWPAPVQLRVRMGLHTGEVDERDG